MLYDEARHAFRLLRNNPAFALTAVVALTLGIGANVAVFSIVNTVLLKPVAFADADRLVMMMISQDDNPLFAASSPAQFMHYREQIAVIEDVAAFRPVSLTYAADETPVSIQAASVSEAYFRAFRTPFSSGRGFAPDEDRPGAELTTVISHRFWTERLSADPDAVGSTLRLSGDSYRIVGIVGADFDVREFGNPEVWVPLMIEPNTTDRGYFLQVVARLRDGIQLPDAQRQLEASVAGYLESFPSEFGPRGGFSALPLQEAIVGSAARTSVLILSGAVTFVLLIACANVANLLLVRASGRRREFAIRAALGARRGHIVRQLLAEGTLLALIGGALGLALGYLGMRALLAVDTANLPRLGDGGSLATLDWRIVAFTVLLSLMTAIVFSLLPAIAGASLNVAQSINDSSTRSGRGSRQKKTQSALVIAEIASAVLLLIGAALLVRTSLALNRVDPGFNAGNLITMRTSLSGEDFSASSYVAEVVRVARERIRSLPGVIQVAASCCNLPGQPGGWGLPFNIPGRENEGLYTGGGLIVFTSPGYLEVFEIPLVRGRTLQDSDDAAGPPVVIVNDALAREYWPGDSDALSDRILVGGGAVNMEAYAEEPLRQIVGIVGDVRHTGLAAEPEPVVYVPQAQLPDAFNELVMSAGSMDWIVRTQGDPLSVSSAIQAELRAVSGMPVTDVRTMDDVLALSVSRQRLHMLLMTVFGSAALLLAAIGIYALMASVVQQRVPEIGIRLALGAEPGVVRGMVIRQGARIAGAGLAIGLISAYFLSNVLSSVLFEVEPRDPLAFIAIPIVLAIVSIAAVAIPALRASRVDAAISLRHE